MSTVELARRWFEEVWNQKSDQTMDQLLSPNCSGFMEGAGEIVGPDGFKAFRSRLLTAFPDLRITVEDAIAAGEKVVVRWVARATHQGPGLEKPAKGNKIELRGLTWLEFEGGLLVRGWSNWDYGGMLQQMEGPPPGGEGSQ
jgi:steroid delta-isomerase-like uncharacterized protein